MDDKDVQQVLNDPKFQLLIKKRSRFAILLTVIMCIIYFGFIAILAFDPELFGTPLAADTVITIGIPVGVGVILSAVVITGIYVWRTNTKFDRMTTAVVAEVLK